MVGRSIADIHNPKRHIYQGAKHRGKYTAVPCTDVSGILA